ncbi:MAG TPA: hypothetical protein VG269_15900 [Tepidisphaeraceae bacterium]|jgi:hypothetical protein|nr:hypothetical protein [Tepidisphaeraceae bacterium]
MPIERNNIQNESGVLAAVEITYLYVLSATSNPAEFEARIAKLTECVNRFENPSPAVPPPAFGLPERILDL